VTKHVVDYQSPTIHAKTRTTSMKGANDNWYALMSHTRSLGNRPSFSVMTGIAENRDDTLNTSKNIARQKTSSSAYLRTVEGFALGSFTTVEAGDDMGNNSGC
jgi:hypothetical protein